MLAAIPSRVFTLQRFRVIVGGLAVGAAPPRTVSAVRSPSSPYRLNKVARRPAAQQFVPHRDPLRLLPPRAAPTRRASPLLGAAIGVARACGPPDPQTRRQAHARVVAVHATPSDGQPHPKPCAAPPCSSLRSCGAASRRTAQGLPRGELRPCFTNVTGGHGSVLPRVREGGHYRADIVPESESLSPVSE